MIEIGVSEIVNLITLIIIGFVFYIQKKQIEQQKDVISTMNNYIEILKIDEVKKYVKLQEENVKMELKHILANDEKVDKIINDISKNTLGKVQEFYKQKTGAKVNELMLFCIYTLSQLEKEDRNLLINSKFPLNKEFLNKTISDVEKHKNS